MYVLRVPSRVKEMREHCKYQRSHGISDMCRPASDANEWCD